MVNLGCNKAISITYAQPAQPSTGILALGKPGCQIPVRAGWERSCGMQVPASVLAIATVQAVLKTLQMFAGSVLWQ